MTPEFVYLASASPRRRALLEQIGVPFRVCAVDLDERGQPGESPRDYVLRLAQGKAEAAWERLAVSERQPVLAADTAVVVGDAIFGKPQDRGDALRMLQQLAGRSHEVFTAVALRDRRGLDSRLSVSQVSFRRLATGEAERYWLTGEPSDKAGAYAVQGYAAAFIEALQGSYSGVMGLPLCETAELLAEAGVQIWRKDTAGAGPQGADCPRSTERRDP